MKKIITETKTIILNTKTNEQFVNCTVSTDSNKPAIILVREDGSTKEVAPSTFKRWYKTTEITVETEIEVEEPKAESKPLTKHQVAAKHNIYYGYGWVVGGHENDLSDNGTEMPSIEDMFEEVYDEVTSCTFDAGFCDTKGAPICMKFAGKQFILDYIAKLFREDGYEVPEELTQVKKNTKAGHSNFVDGERVNLRADEADKVVTVKAFTGMVIGTFEIKKETSSTITVETRKGVMKFSKETGLQVDAAEARYANRIEL